MGLAEKIEISAGSKEEKVEAHGKLRALVETSVVASVIGAPAAALIPLLEHGPTVTNALPMIELAPSITRIARDAGIARFIACNASKSRLRLSRQGA